MPIGRKEKRWVDFAMVTVYQFSILKEKKQKKYNILDAPLHIKIKNVLTFKGTAFCLDVPMKLFLW